MSRIVVLLALTACAASTPPPKRSFGPSDRDAVKAVLDAQVTAWNAGNLDGYMDGYAKTDWLVFTSGGKVRRGWQETHDTFQKKYATEEAAMGRLAFEILSVDPIGADGAVVLGN
ncbi:MAG: hypothetical protein WKG01_30150 [Kofleriaceae bacterium]